MATNYMAGINNNINSLLASYSLTSQKTGMSGVGGLNSLLGGSSWANTNMVNLVNSQQNLNRAELGLKTASSTLTAKIAAEGGTRTAESSNTTQVTATASQTTTAGVYNVKIANVATAQVTQSTPVAGSQTTGITTVSGWGQMQITKGASNYLVSYQVTAADTNTQALGKIASAINNEPGLGISAQVSTDSSGNSKITLTGDTGVASAYTISDTVGNAASITSLNSPANITQQAQNSNFTVNGAAFSTASNTAQLNNSGITLNLKSATPPEGADITVKANATITYEQDIRNFVNNYNETLNTLKYDTSGNAQTSAKNLKNTTAAAASSLSNIGIEVKSSGELQINEAKFKTALSTRPEDVKAALGGAGGFAGLVGNEATRALNKSVTTSPFSGGFSSYLSGLAYSPSMNQFNASNFGMFFNTNY